MEGRFFGDIIRTRSRKGEGELTFSLQSRLSFFNFSFTSRISVRRVDLIKLELVELEIVI